jgi:hypothetical protein
VSHQSLANLCTHATILHAIITTFDTTTFRTQTRIGEKKENSRFHGIENGIMNNRLE